MNQNVDNWNPSPYLIDFLIASKLLCCFLFPWPHYKPSRVMTHEGWWCGDISQCGVSCQPQNTCNWGRDGAPRGSHDTAIRGIVVCFWACQLQQLNDLSTLVTFFACFHVKCFNQTKKCESLLRRIGCFCCFTLQRQLTSISLM